MQGGKQASQGTVRNAPFDFFVARKERRSYKDPKTGQVCTANENRRPLPSSSRMRSSSRAVICAMLAGYP